MASTGRTIFFLLKFCEKREYAEDFLAGRIFVNRLSYYQQQPTAEDGRGDPLEGAAAIYQPRPDQIIEIAGERIDPMGLAGPMILHMMDVLERRALCLYSAHSGEFRGVSKDTLPAFLEQMAVPPQMMAMGDHAVLIRNFGTFQQRLVEAAKRHRVSLKGALVDYVDMNTHHGRIENPGFVKSNDYQWQRESRYLIDDRGQLGDPPFFDVGDLSDICTIIDPKTINSTFEVRLPEEE